ncbi:P-type conjugative transfer protein TrbL [Brevundimonas staleyi]|uniref:P-type conjugative transfer protein TrbL n=1 Tax=Brevundimonas staleyi TaxID=74326 RepID=A0ABW0FX31_9CAUL
MAATASMDTPNELMVVFSDTVSAGFEALQAPVNGIFGLMITLVVALTGIQWALSANRDLLAAGFGKVLLIGAFAYLINDWQGLSETIQAGFVDLGLAAGGGSLSRADFLNPGAVLHTGWEIVRALGETPAPVANPLDVAGNLVDALILGLAMIGILLAFAVLALQIIVTLLEFKIVTLGGFVLLPFGIWSKSAFLAERPLGYVVASGLKVLALAIVVSGASAVFDQLQPSANPDMHEALAILVAALLLAMLAIFIPNLAAALVTGGPALGAGAAVTGALAVAGAGTLAGAAVAGAGAATAGAAARLSGSARAAAGGPPARGGGTGARGHGPFGPSGPGSTPGGTPGSAPPRAEGSGGPRTPPSGPAAHDPGAARPPDGAPTGVGEKDTAGAPLAPGQTAGRPPDRIAAEAEAARRDFHAAARAGPGSSPPPAGTGRGRSAAFQTYVAANTGRSLFPAGETSGSLSLQLKTEDR